MKHPYLHLITSVLIVLATALLLTIGCGNRGETPEGPKAPPQVSKDFKNHWYDGKAELSSYALTQYRYGQPRRGEAVLVFVTEPFDTELQVKSDREDENDIQVLKMNQMRKFNTGIYPYSLMTSVFTEVDTKKPRGPVKMTQSSQEWCGHSWLQFNEEKRGYRYQQHSYFESESDAEAYFPVQILEDGVWSQIRMNPSALPTGAVEMIPAGHFLRFSHITPQAYTADAALKTAGDSTTYTIEYRGISRKVSISFENAFPYRILSWEEVQEGRNGKMERSAAYRKGTERLAYWTLNSIQDSTYRQNIGME